MNKQPVMLDTPAVPTQPKNLNATCLIIGCGTGGSNIALRFHKNLQQVKESWCHEAWRTFCIDAHGLTLGTVSSNPEIGCKIIGNGEGSGCYPEVGKASIARDAEEVMSLLLPASGHKHQLAILIVCAGGGTGAAVVEEIRSRLEAGNLKTLVCIVKPADQDEVGSRQFENAEKLIREFEMSGRVFSLILNDVAYRGRRKSMSITKAYADMDQEISLQLVQILRIYHKQKGLDRSDFVMNILGYVPDCVVNSTAGQLSGRKLKMASAVLCGFHAETEQDLDADTGGRPSDEEDAVPDAEAITKAVMDLSQNSLFAFSSPASAIMLLIDGVMSGRQRGFLGRELKRVFASNADGKELPGVMYKADTLEAEDGELSAMGERRSKEVTIYALLTEAPKNVGEKANIQELSSPPEIKKTPRKKPQVTIYSSWQNILQEACHDDKRAIDFLSNGDPEDLRTRMCPHTRTPILNFNIRGAEFGSQVDRHRDLLYRAKRHLRLTQYSPFWKHTILTGVVDYLNSEQIYLPGKWVIYNQYSDRRYEISPALDTDTLLKIAESGKRHELSQLKEYHPKTYLTLQFLLRLRETFGSDAVQLLREPEDSRSRWAKIADTVKGKERVFVPIPYPEAPERPAEDRAVEQKPASKPSKAVLEVSREPEVPVIPDSLGTAETLKVTAVNGNHAEPGENPPGLLQ